MSTFDAHSRAAERLCSESKHGQTLPKATTQRGSHWLTPTPTTTHLCGAVSKAWKATQIPGRGSVVQRGAIVVG
jgi:hypothetical protein